MDDGAFEEGEAALRDRALRCAFAEGVRAGAKLATECGDMEWAAELNRLADKSASAPAADMLEMARVAEVGFQRIRCGAGEKRAD